MKRHPHARHVKYPASVDAVEGDRWWARIWNQPGNYPYLIVEMRGPPPPEAEEGRIFSIHRTKRGEVYLYWPKGPLLTKRQLKKARIWGREMAALFADDEDV